MKADAPLYIGIMSGTSMDGIDAALCSFTDGACRVHSAATAPIPDALRQRLVTLQSPAPDEIHTMMLAANDLAEGYGALVADLLRKGGLQASDIRAIGCHGQTIRHQPAAGYTVQINNGALLAEHTQIDVVCDFRSRDIAAGGQGAPLVPAFHRAVFGHPSIHRAILNIGGMANLTDLPPDDTTSGFDCGPGNVLLDDWTLQQTGHPFDDDGRWAASGAVITPLLNTLLDHPFFSRKPPKSCGREDFNLAWLQSQAREYPGAANDIQATLLELTARSIANAVLEYCKGTEELVVCGGGAKNGTLMRRLATLLPAIKITTTAKLGLAVETVESAAFAWLAHRYLNDLSGNLPSVTGAHGERILGALHKH